MNHDRVRRSKGVRRVDFFGMALCVLGKKERPFYNERNNCDVKAQSNWASKSLEDIDWTKRRQRQRVRLALGVLARMVLSYKGSFHALQQLWDKACCEGTRHCTTE